MKPALRMAAAVALGAAVALAFYGWLQPDNVFSFAASLAFCQ